MNVRNFLFMNLTGKVLPFANLEDIMLAQTLGEKVRTIIGNPLTFRTKKAQKAKNPSLTLLPVQDLHGYDKPWVGGMSDQLLDESTAEQGTIDQTTGEDATSNNVKRSGFMPTNGATNLFLTSDNSMRFFWYDASRNYLSNDACQKNNYVAVPNGTAYFRVIGINSIWNYSIMINSGTTPKPYCPYENICTISGRTKLNLWGTGRNMLPTSLATIKTINTTGTWSGDEYTINNVTFAVQTENGKVTGINANGQASADATLLIYGNTLSVQSQRTITFKEPVKFRIGTTGDGSASTYLGVVWSPVQNKFVYGSVLVDSGYQMNGFGIRVKSGYNAQNLLFRPFISMDIGENVFYPYEESVNAQFNFDNTIYGGTINLDTGILTVDTLRVDLGSLSWSASSAPIVFFADPRTLGEFIGVGKTFIACDSYQCQDNAGGVGTVRNYPDGSICGFTNPDAYYHRIYVKDTRFNDANEFSNEVNGVYACYKLATPQTIQLTPQEINLLKGINNIWTDGDSIELTYKG